MFDRAALEAYKTSVTYLMDTPHSFVSLLLSKSLNTPAASQCSLYNTLL